MSTFVSRLAEEIKDKGRRSAAELPALLHEAEQLAEDKSQEPLIRALAYRAAGNALQLLNRFRPAVDNYDRALAILETLDNELELGRTLLAKVGILFFLSDFEGVFDCSAWARELFEKSGDRHRLARLDVNLAHAFHRLDRHPEALECSERALQILEETRDTEGYVAAAINSAVSLTAMHDFGRAEERYRDALQVATEAGMTSMALMSRYNLAYLRYLRGDTAQSLHELAGLREEFVREGDERHVCLIWLDEAEILLEIGCLEDAIAAAQKSREGAATLGLNAELGRSLLFESAALLRLDRVHEATPLLEEATRRFEAEGNGVWTAVSKLQTALLRGEHGVESALCEALSARRLLEGCGLLHRQALADIVIGRIQRTLGDMESAIESFRLAETAARKSRSQWMQFHALLELGLSLSKRNDPGGALLLREAEGMLDSLWNRLGSDDLKIAFMTDRENVYTHLLQSLVTKSNRSAFEISEKARSRVLRETLVGPEMAISADTIQVKLSSEETIVEYFVLGDDLCIFSLNSNQLNCIVRPGVVPRIQSEWGYLQRHLVSCSVTWDRLSAVRQQLQEAARDHLRELYRELLEPVAGDIRGSVIVVPHAFLHSVPFQALYDGDQFAGEKYCVSYSPSAALYCTPAPFKEAKEAKDWAPPLFVAFSHEKNGSSVSEVEEAAAHFSNATILVNPSIAVLREAFDLSRTLVHIAGHAGIDTVGGTFSWIETANGRLTGRDLRDMHVHAKTLVVTGCKTAHRAILPGDEWQGLMRSFYLCGASAIVSAFWDIRADSARQFAGHFYRDFDQQNVPGAVQKAAAALREREAHPYFWAGFGTFLRKDVW